MTSRTTSSKSKRKTSTKRTAHRTGKKPKVYIPAYKAIILCCAIITICMGLLLVTTLKEPDRRLSDAAIQRYKEEIVDSKKQPSGSEISDVKEKEAEKKPEPKKTETPKKVETPQSREEKKPVETKEVTPTPAPAPAPAQTPEPTPAAKPKPQPEQKTKYNFPKAKNGAQLIFVFDDGGQNLAHLKPFLNLPFPVTVAVLPQIAHSKETASQVRASGNEVILHQPMQSVNASVNPGPGAIKPDMSEEEIKSLLFQNVTEIAPIAGMNNHEGSGITADAEKMATVLQFCSQEGIYFLDSRTNVETKVPYVARELGYSWYERNIFFCLFVV